MGNLYIVNQTEDFLYLYVDGETLPLKEVPPRPDFFLVDVANPSGVDRTLKVWKRGDVPDPAVPDPAKLFRRWDVVLSTEKSEDQRTTWVIIEGGGTGTGTLQLNYPEAGEGDIGVIYSVDVFLNSQQGSRVTALSPGTEKKVGVEYGYHVLYFLYWFSDPNSAEGRRDIDWIEYSSEGQRFNVLLNDASRSRSVEVPVFYNSTVGRIGKIEITNERDSDLQIIADGQLIEDILTYSGPTTGLSIIEGNGGSYTFTIPEGRYRLEAKDLESTSLVDSLSNFDVIEQYPCSWRIEIDKNYGYLEIRNLTGEKLTIHDIDSERYLGITLEPGEERAMRIEAGINGLRAISWFKNQSSTLESLSSSWTIDVLSSF